MPYLHIQISGEADDRLAADVAARAVELTSGGLGKDAALTAVVVDFVPAARWFIGGRVLEGRAERSYHWLVTITDETNTKAEKAAYLSAVHEAMGALLGSVAEHSYVHIADLRAAAYGYGGRTQEARYQRAG